jgi:NitT/TauT family transport system substrate-binding protein
MKLSTTAALAALLVGFGVLGANVAYASDDEQLAQACASMRKIKIGISVTPPNVVHTPPFVAKDLGYFAKHCVDAELLQFEGGLSQTMRVALSSGEAMGNMDPVAVANGLKGKQVWLMAPRMPQAYVVSGGITKPADLKGKRLNAAGGGVGGFNWRMGREILRMGGLTVDDAQFISTTLQARVPSLLQGQTDGVALHPEDILLATTKNPAVHVLVPLSEAMPNLTFNTYGAADSMIARDRDLVRDAVAAMIEATRAIYKEREKVLPVIMKATERSKEDVTYALDYLTKNCVWAVNTGFDMERLKWSLNYYKEQGDIQEQGKNATAEEMVDMKLAEDALAKAGGRTTIGACKD